MHVAFAGRRIPLTLECRERQRLSITVHPDCSVNVLAPVGHTVEQIQMLLQRRASWIARQQRHFTQFHPMPIKKRYTSGETHFYLGRQYRLRVRQGEYASVKMVGRYINALVPDPQTPSAVSAALDDWYRTHAIPIFEARMQRCVSSAKALRSVRPSIRIRRMRTRWGSCTRAGTVTLNLDLIKTPTHCIEYVIMHELCHLQVHDHSPAFYRLLSRCMPDWQHRKERLDSIVLA
jgi:predicted metal-dependent hydrolase